MEFMAKVFYLLLSCLFTSSTTFIGAIPRVTFEIHQYSSELLELLFELLDQKSSGGGKVSSAERKTIKQQQDYYQKSGGGCIYCNIKVAGGIHFDEIVVHCYQQIESLPNQYRRTSILLTTDVVKQQSFLKQKRDVNNRFDSSLGRR